MGLTERASNKPTVDYRGVRFTADRVALLDGDHEVVTIPLDNIRALTLRRGFTADRPLPEALLGVACCVLATLALRRVVLWLLRGGTLWDIQIFLLLLLPLGISLLRHALSHGFYLLVELKRGRRKFPFVGGLDQRFPDVMRQAESLSRKTIDWRRSPWLVA
jgi:hypothetical protein